MTQLNVSDYIDKTRENGALKEDLVWALNVNFTLSFKAYRGRTKEKVDLEFSYLRIKDYPVNFIEQNIKSFSF